jgi:hypothetical protein
VLGLTAPTVAEAMDQALTPTEREQFTNHLRPLVWNRGLGISRMTTAHLGRHKASIAEQQRPAITQPSDLQGGLLLLALASSPYLREQPTDATTTDEQKQSGNDPAESSAHLRRHRGARKADEPDDQWPESCTRTQSNRRIWIP